VFGGFFFFFLFQTSLVLLASMRVKKLKYGGFIA